MLNEQVVKKFFLEVYEKEENYQPEKSQELLHAKKISDSREYRGVYLFYEHLWLEEECKNQKIKSGLF